MLLLSVITSFLPIISALQISSCIKYESYMTTQYRMAPLEFPDSWFSHSLRFSPRKVTKISFRTRRLFGCCEFGYTFVGFPRYTCQPLCYSGCQMNAHCTAPNECTCDYGYHKDPTKNDELCWANETIASEKFLETTTDVLIETTTLKIPCNGSCSSNEICSMENNVCICQSGFERSNETLGCIPRCGNGCQNADCTSPNTCTCWPHYERTNDTSCHLKCTDLSCTFGECNEIGTCICAAGFFNNGTNCLWEADDVFSEPDYCECWSRFKWQTNSTENRCMQSCDDVDISKDDCIPFGECVFYEGYTICHAQIFKCIEIPVLSTTIIPYMADKATRNTAKTSTEMMFLILGLCTFLLVAVGSLWILNKRRNWFNQLWSYRAMDNTQQNDEEV